MAKSKNKGNADMSATQRARLAALHKSFWTEARRKEFQKHGWSPSFRAKYSAHMRGS